MLSFGGGLSLQLCLPLLVASGAVRRRRLRQDPEEEQGQEESSLVGEHQGLTVSDDWLPRRALEG